MRKTTEWLGGLVRRVYFFDGMEVVLYAFEADIAPDRRNVSAKR